MAQLRMMRPNLENLPPVKPPEGYEIRHYQPCDEIHWGAIIDSSFGGQRTVGDVRREITERPVFTPEGLFFATYQGKPVATACSWKASPDETRTGYVHMVGVMPEHQGHRLGYLLSLATLHFFKEHGFQRAMLDTDDWRIPALITYLRLDFEPVLRDDGQRHRWALIFSKFLKSAPKDIHPVIRRYFTRLELIGDLSIENYQSFFETVCNLSLEDYRQIGVAGNPAPSEFRRLDNDLAEKIKTIPIREPLSQERVYQLLKSYLNTIRIQSETPISEAHLRKISHNTTSPKTALNHLGICLAFSAYRQKMGTDPQITDDDLECCCNRRVISWIE
ncbi:TPA: GNAT family N-acetyltransferase [Candidatus Poribacteria bacterium]|nr:GNAT family N-acetyltransferase [Candidatus Poribacteria bacterium]